MTEPMNAEAVAQMVADREAGTPGPWESKTGVKVCESEFSQWIYAHKYGCLGYWTGHKDRHEGIHSWLLTEVDARRIARLPDIEAAYLALAAENATLARKLDAAQKTCETYRLANRTNLDRAIAAENATLRDMMENAAQAMSETQPSWEYRCHAIMAALQLDFGGPTPDIPEEHTWYARNLRMANQRADKAEDESRTLRASEAAAVERVTRLELALQEIAGEKFYPMGIGIEPTPTREAKMAVKALTPTTDKEPKT